MTVEVWKSVVGLEGYYEVSNLGRVRSIDRVIRRIDGRNRTLKGRILVTSNVCGYPAISIWVTGKNIKTYVHRLVAIAFIPNPENKPQVNHIDGIKTNNNAENLEWVTNQENAVHAHKNGLKISTKGIDHPKAKLTPELIREAIVTFLLKAGMAEGFKLFRLLGD